MIVSESCTPFTEKKISDLPANSGTYSYNAFFFLIYSNFNYGHCYNPPFAPHLFMLFTCFEKTI